jgi:hypothetical protein
MHLEGRKSKKDSLEGFLANSFSYIIKVLHFAQKRQSVK